MTGSEPRIGTLSPDDYVGPVVLTYTEPHPAGQWTCPPISQPSRSRAESYIAGITRLAGPAAAARRVWSIAPAVTR